MRHLWRELSPARMVWLNPLLAIFCVFIDFHYYDPVDRLADCWTGPVAVVTSLALCWDGPQLLRRRLALTLAWFVSLFTIMGALTDIGLLAGLRIGVVTMTVMTLMMLTYRRVLADRYWYPARVVEVLALMILIVTASALLVVLSGVPYAGIVAGLDLRNMLWWFGRVGSYLVYGIIVVFALWFSPLPPRTRVMYRAYLPLGILISVVCMCVPYLYPEYPLSWLVCVPAVWIGLTLTPRSAAVALAVIGFIPGPFENSALSRVTYNGWLPPSLAMQFVICAAAMLATIVVVFRENAARLTHELGQAFDHQLAQNALLTSVISSMNDGVLLTNPDGAILLSNPAARALLGRPVGAAAGVGGWVRAYGFRRLDGTELSVEEIAALQRPSADVPIRQTLALPRAGDDGGDMRVYAIASSFLGHRRDQLSLVLVSDVTAQHSRHRELESFAGTVAHDLRNPLASLTLWMDLADTELDADPTAGVHALDQAREASGRMGALIDDYLHYTVTRQGALRVGPVELSEIAHEVAAMHLGGTNPPTFAIEAGVVLQADAGLVRQLLLNLVANSVKYARPGVPAHIRIRALPDKEPGWACVQVEDRGQGIRAEDRATIFKPFARGQQGPATPGLGLGLALCEAIVHRHHGYIVALDNAYGGLTIEFTLPLARELVS